MKGTKKDISNEIKKMGMEEQVQKRLNIFD